MTKWISYIWTPNILETDKLDSPSQYKFFYSFIWMQYVVNGG